jgi:short-subunit dehydrogenase
VKDLAGRKALLTGASGGLAPFIARRLREAGVRLLLSARNAEACRLLAGELGEADVVPADLSNRADLNRLIEAAQDVDILVSNASVLAAGELLTVSEVDLDRAIDVNLRAPLLLCKALGGRMAERGGGHIVLMASIAGKMASPDYPVYTATKFAVRGLGLALREDFKSRRIGVSLVSPTFVAEAGMWAAAERRAHPMAGEVSPDAVADAIVKAIRGNRLEVNVMPLATRVSTRLGAAIPEIGATVAEKLGASRVPGDAIERQREREGVSR